MIISTISLLSIFSFCCSIAVFGAWIYEVREHRKLQDYTDTLLDELDAVYDRQNPAQRQHKATDIIHHFEPWRLK